MNGEIKWTKDEKRLPKMLCSGPEGGVPHSQGPQPSNNPNNTNNPKSVSELHSIDEKRFQISKDSKESSPQKDEKNEKNSKNSNIINKSEKNNKTKHILPTIIPPIKLSGIQKNISLNSNKNNISKSNR